MATSAKLYTKRKFEKPLETALTAAMISPKFPCLQARIKIHMLAGERSSLFKPAKARKRRLNLSRKVPPFCAAGPISAVEPWRRLAFRLPKAQMWSFQLLTLCSACFPIRCAVAGSMNSERLRLIS
jgi:hypothetical protein